MTALVAPRLAPARRQHRVPWSPRVWLQALYQTAGIPALLVAPLVVVLSGVKIGPGHVKVDLLPGLAIVFLAVPLLTAVQRHRLRVTTGVVIVPQPVIARRLSGPGIVAAALFWIATSDVGRRRCGHRAAHYSTLSSVACRLIAVRRIMAARSRNLPSSP